MPDIDQIRLSYLRKLRNDLDYLPHSIPDYAVLRGDWDTAPWFIEHRDEMVLRERAEVPSE